MIDPSYFQKLEAMTQRPQTLQSNVNMPVSGMTPTQTNQMFSPTPVQNQTGMGVQQIAQAGQPSQGGPSMDQIMAAIAQVDPDVFSTAPAQIQAKVFNGQNVLTSQPGAPTDYGQKTQGIINLLQSS